MAEEKSIQKQIIDHTIKFSLGTVLKGAGQFINQYFAALLLGPATFGIWQGVKLILSYGGCSGLGSLEGMHREIPILRGRGDSEKILEIRDAAFIYNFVATAFLSGLILAITFFINVSPQTILALRFIAIILFIQFFKSFAECWLKAHNGFGIISKISIMDGIGLAISVVLIFFFSFAGFLAGYALSICISTVYAFSNNRIPVVLKWSSKALKSLIFIGFPIMLIGLSAALFQTADRLLILKFLDTKALGLYSLGWLAFMPIMFIFYAASSVMYPRFTERFGKTGDDRDLRNFMVLPTKYLALSTPVLIGGILVVLPIAVKIFLPEYINGIDAAKILLFGLFFESVVAMAGNFFLATNRQIFYLGILLGSVLVNLILSFTFLKLGLGILGVAIGTSISYFVFFLVMIFTLMIYCRFNGREMIKFLLQILLPLIYILIVSFLVEKFVNIGGESMSSLIKNAFLKEFVFLTLSSYLIYSALRNIEIKNYFLKR